jgi:hypothetical protein
MTPVGGRSTVGVPGAYLTALSNTSFEWVAGADGAMTITLDHGAVDCQVEPRKGKPPFRVIAGDITVTVVGTRFTVTKTPSPRVDVVQGLVKVEWSGNITLVEAGQTWAPFAQTTAQQEEAPTEPPAAPEIEMDAMHVAKPAHVAKKVTTPSVRTEPAPEAAPASQPQTDRALEQESYNVAIKQLEATDPKAAAKVYRSIVTSGKANAAVALYALAELHLYRLKDAKLDDLDELARKFPKSANAEDAAWLRVQALQKLGNRDEARGAAADYLRQFPNGTYADSAVRLTK